MIGLGKDVECAQVNYSLHNSNNEVVDFRSVQSEVLLSCSLMQNACWPRL